MISKAVIIFNLILPYKLAFAETVEQFSLEVTYHGSQMVMLKKIKARELEAQFLIHSQNQEEATAQRITATEYSRRRKNLVRLKKKLDQDRSLASVCSRYIKITLNEVTNLKVGPKVSTYCSDFMGLEQNKLTSRWLKSGH